MHIPDGWIDVPTSAAGAAVAVAGTAVAARKAAASLKARTSTMPMVVAAYLLVAQLLVLPLGLGTGAHLVGTGLAALLAGPWVAIVSVAAVVVIQALFLADGGVTAIGLNIVNDGIVPALVAVAVAPALRRPLGAIRAAGVAGAVSALAAGGMVALEFAVGGDAVLDEGLVTATIGGAHLLLAVVEGILTAGIIGTVARLRPDLLWFRTAPAKREPAEANA